MHPRSRATFLGLGRNTYVKLQNDIRAQLALGSQGLDENDLYLLEETQETLADKPVAECQA